MTKEEFIMKLENKTKEIYYMTIEERADLIGQIAKRMETLAKLQNKYFDESVVFDLVFMDNINLKKLAKQIIK